MSTFVSGKSRPRLLGIFAHPDDECFCAGGTLAAYAAAGAEVMVVSATRGDAGQIRDARAATRRTLGEARERELRQACAALGVRQAVCLDYGDGTLSDTDPNLLVRDLAGIIRAFRPDAVLTFGEDGAYGHPDHIAISRATTAACALAGDGEQFAGHATAGLGPHSPIHLYHCRFPRGRMLLMDRLVEWLVGHGRLFQGNGDFVRGLMFMAEETTVLGYVRDHIEVEWYPAGFSIVEQGEPATKLYHILSGAAEVIREEDDGTTRTLDRLGPGVFFGETGLAYGKPRNAHVVAREAVTCLVFSPAQPTAFTGRGGQARPELALVQEAAETPVWSGETTCIDVTAHVGQKIRAIACHRTQYPIDPDMFPLALLQEMMGREYFVRVAPDPRAANHLSPKEWLAAS